MSLGFKRQGVSRSVVAECSRALLPVFRQAFSMFIREESYIASLKMYSNIEGIS